jgi:molecular chaperone GrpE (heat shock protein)
METPLDEAGGEAGTRSPEDALNRGSADGATGFEPPGGQVGGENGEPRGAAAEEPEDDAPPAAEGPHGEGTGDTEGDGSARDEEGGGDGELAAAVAALDVRLEEAQRLHARQSDLVDRLHAENQSLRAGEVRGAQLPLIRDLLRLHDDVGRLREAAAGDGDDGDLRIAQEGLVDVLARSGVESFAPEKGELFDPRMHAAAGAEPTADAALDKAVAEIVRQGFRWDSGEVIRVAEVRAYRYQGAAPDQPPATDL